MLLIFFLFLVSSVAAFAGTDEISLEEVVRISLESNPRLASFYELFLSSQERWRFSGSQPNPEVILAAPYEVYPEDSNIFSQPLELFGRPRWRKSVAFSAKNASEARYMTALLDLLSDVSLAYVDALKARHLRIIEEENMKLAADILKVATKRYEVGDIPQYQLLEAQVEYSRAQTLFEEATLKEQNALVYLGRLAGKPLNPLSSLNELPLAIPDRYPDIATLKNRAVAERPEVAMARWEQEEMAAQSSLIQSELQPDVILSTYRKKLDSESMQGYRVSLRFPLFDWGSVRGEFKAQEKKKEAARKTLEDMKLQVAWETEQAFNEVTNARKRLAILNDTVLTSQERITSMVQRGYEAGLNNYLEVLEARRSLREIKKNYNETLADCQKASIRLERASCTSLFSRKEHSHEKK
ncbi:MAG: TolC family protein [Candidatus Eremiobacteraeota bacterium]|nr:TolC family protein [Candidatus Eremiobacteraeota bacterium]